MRLLELKVDRSGSARIVLGGNPVVCSAHFLDNFPPMVSLICPKAGRLNSKCFGCDQKVKEEKIILSCCFDLHERKWKLLALTSYHFGLVKEEVLKYAGSDTIAQGKGPDILIQTRNKFICKALVETMSAKRPIDIPNIQEMIPQYASKSLWTRFTVDEIRDWYNRSWGDKSKGRTNA